MMPLTLGALVFDPNTPDPENASLHQIDGKLRRIRAFMGMCTAS